MKKANVERSQKGKEMKVHKKANVERSQRVTLMNVQKLCTNCLSLEYLVTISFEERQ